MLLSLPPELFELIVREMCFEGWIAEVLREVNEWPAVVLNLYMCSKMCRDLIKAQQESECIVHDFNDVDTDDETDYVLWEESVAHTIYEERIDRACKALKKQVSDDPRLTFFPCAMCKGNIGPSILDKRFCVYIWDDTDDHVEKYVVNGLKWMEKTCKNVVCVDCVEEHFTEGGSLGHRYEEVRVPSKYNWYPDVKALPEGPEYDKKCSELQNEWES
jgi:hypothetical protein